MKINDIFGVMQPQDQNGQAVRRQLDRVLSSAEFVRSERLSRFLRFVGVRDFPLWSGRFDRALADVLAVQDEISRGIVNNLRLKLGHGRPAKRKPARGPRQVLSRLEILSIQ